MAENLGAGAIDRLAILAAQIGAGPETRELGIWRSD